MKTNYLDALVKSGEEGYLFRPKKWGDPGHTFGNIWMQVNAPSGRIVFLVNGEEDAPMFLGAMTYLGDWEVKPCE